MPVSPAFVLLFAQAASRPANGARGWTQYSPNVLFVALVATLVIGASLKLAAALKARQAVENLAGDRPGADAIARSVEGGRRALVDLFRLLDSGADDATRRGAGAAIATLWKRDELIAEEERALVTRGFSATWKARRRYPRGLNRPIPFAVEFGLPFLHEEGDGIAPGSLEWSARIAGSDRAALEAFGPWTPGGGRAAFSVDPRDYPTNGPHRRILHARVRTRDLTSQWEFELPQVPFSFDFDPNLSPTALLGTEDETRARAIAAAVRLVLAGGEAESPAFVALNAEFALRGIPRLKVSGGLPSDLACSVALEFEGVAESLECAGIVALKERRPDSVESHALSVEGRLPAGAIVAPGEHRVRVVLTPDVHLGWSDPEVRSVWPGVIRTEWSAARIVRR